MNKIYLVKEEMEYSEIIIKAFSTMELAEKYYKKRLKFFKNVLESFANFDGFRIIIELHHIKVIHHIEGTMYTPESNITSLEISIEELKVQ